MKCSIVAFAVLGGSAAFACAQETPIATDAADAGRREACVECSNAGNAAARPESVVFTKESASDAERHAHAARRGDGRVRVDPSSEFGAITIGRRQSLEYVALAGVEQPVQHDAAASNVIDGAGRQQRRSLEFRTARFNGIRTGASYGMDGIDGSAANRAWGMSLGIETGPVVLRIAHQNRHVAKVHLYDLAGNNMEAKNSIIAANVQLGWGKAYAAYSINRGWGSSPLFNPDNPYGASVFSTPSTDSRDVLVGLAVPAGKYTTLLASFIHKNDRDRANQDANQIALGATYTLARRTDVYAAWTYIENIGGAGSAMLPSPMRGRAMCAFNLGFRHAF